VKLSVIIPCYKDDPTQAIDSIKAQLYYDPRDVEILLCMDDPERDVLTYPDVVTLQAETNTGAGLARQRGLDAARGEYVTFLDADDIWYNLLGYSLFLRDVYWQGGNIIDIAKFGILEQMPNGGFSVTTGDSTWCFGKIFRRAFLRSNEIQFRSDLRVHEDSYFVRLAEMCNPQVLNHGDMVYLWRANPQSTVRDDGGSYWQREFPQYISVLRMLRDERRRRGLAYDAVGDLAYIYAMVARMDDACRDKCIDAIKAANQNWGATALKTQELYARVREAEGNHNTPHLAPRMTLQDFLEELKK